ncbi:MerC domain-containing protein [Hugenholtzia roseola]|uniref:MerC domain-containing protein n=1 Tax=Hugenholtzia roseola TaxID=1002 RepID=UPI000409F8AE|nr:MerC domain-containing protein [Hugenholtzia roseola]
MKFKDLGKIKADVAGMFASTLCLLHCLAAPLFLALQTGLQSAYHGVEFFSTAEAHSHVHGQQELHHHDTASTWLVHWHMLDYAFIVFALIAIYFATRHSQAKRLSTLLWMMGLLFSAALLLEHQIPAFTYVGYFASLMLIILHLLHWQAEKKAQQVCKVQTPPC